MKNYVYIVIIENTDCHMREVKDRIDSVHTTYKKAIKRVKELNISFTGKYFEAYYKKFEVEE